MTAAVLATLAVCACAAHSAATVPAPMASRPAPSADQASPEKDYRYGPGGYPMGPGMMGGHGSMGPGMMQGYGRPYPRSSRSDLDSPAGHAFERACQQCHALPDPRAHSASQWPAVVARMKGYMAQRGAFVPDTATTDAIIGFLQSHARGEEGR